MLGTNTRICGWATAMLMGCGLVPAAGCAGDEGDAAADTDPMVMDGSSTGRGDDSASDGTSGGSTSASATTTSVSGGEDPGDSMGSTGMDDPFDTDEPTGGSSSGTGDALLDCASYCDIYLDACGDFSEYANPQHCMDHCQQWPIGVSEDVAGDTLGCRTYHVTVASSTDPALHCPHAGPSGDGVCVAEEAPDCTLYCSRYFNNCTGELGVYVDEADCLAQCEPWYPGSSGDTQGDSIGCRAYYAGLAAGDPQTHCPSAGPGGGDQCVLPGG